MRQNCYLALVTGRVWLISYKLRFSQIPTHTRLRDPFVSSLSKKSVPHRYPCEISVTNTR